MTKPIARLQNCCGDDLTHTAIVAQMR